MVNGMAYLEMLGGEGARGNPCAGADDIHLKVDCKAPGV